VTRRLIAATATSNGSSPSAVRAALQVAGGPPARHVGFQERDAGRYYVRVPPGCGRVGDRPAGVPMIRGEAVGGYGIIRMIFLIGVASDVGGSETGSALGQIPVPVAEGLGREP
jgi:hypothetical protein